jgi:histone deacetylase 11
MVYTDLMFETGKIPIVFSPYYDIGLYGIENLHPFDSKKYGRIYLHLVTSTGIGQERFYSPNEATEHDLRRVHSVEYLASLKKPLRIAAIAELMSLSIIPGKLLDRHLLRPMRYATGGTILAFSLATQHGWAINLSGGYHHAKSDEGGGFCYYADVPIAARLFWEENPGFILAVVDLDAHQGNGNACILGDDPRVRILDIYNGSIYPGDFEARSYVDVDLPVGMFIGDREYLDTLEKGFEELFNGPVPDIIVYNAGTDVLRGDPLGGMGISEEGIIKRDEMVFDAARSRGIPIVMVLSGGYTRKSAGVIASSIENLLTK